MYLYFTVFYLKRMQFFYKWYLFKQMIILML